MTGFEQELVERLKRVVRRAKDHEEWWVCSYFEVDEIEELLEKIHDTYRLCDACQHPVIDHSITGCGKCKCLLVKYKGK